MVKNILKFLCVCALICVMAFAVIGAPVSFGEIMTVDETDAASLPYESENAVLFEGAGTQEFPYEISDYNEFNYYAKLVNSGNTSYSSAYYALTENINFRGNAIEPMGTETYPFSGHLDGQGYQIYNVAVKDTKYSGVVGYMTEGSVKNLSVSYINSTSRKELATSGIIFGGIVGSAEPANNENVVISGCDANGSFIYSTKDCTYFGGLVGKIVAEKGNVTVSDSIANFGFDIKSTNNSYVAGAIGYAFAGSSTNFILSGCICYGNVKLEVTNGVEAKVGGFAAYVGKDESDWSGWAGEEASLSADVNNIENCFSAGNVYGSSYYLSLYRKAHVGGFIGRNENPENVKIVNAYKSADASVDALGTILLCDIGVSVKSDVYKTESFYKDTVKLDFANDYYMSGDGKVCTRATAKSNGGATTHDTLDMRLDDKAGIRFSSEIELYKRNYVSEYGFIIGVKSDLGDRELTFDCGKRYAYAAAYDIENGIDVVFKNDEITGKAIFKGVLINVPAAYYSEIIVARPYVIYKDSDGSYGIEYGAQISKCYSEVEEVSELINKSESYEN